MKVRRKTNNEATTMKCVIPGSSTYFSGIFYNRRTLEFSVVSFKHNGDLDIKRSVVIWFFRGKNAVMCSEQWTDNFAWNIFRGESGNMILTPPFEFPYPEQFKTGFIRVYLCLYISFDANECTCLKYLWLWPLGLVSSDNVRTKTVLFHT
jgi:hypothetical protein